MAHIIINPSLSAAIRYKCYFNPPKFAVVIANLEPANSTRTDNSRMQASGERSPALHRRPLGSTTLCWHFFEHNRQFLALGIILA